jgi:hypothetical protein
MRCDRNYKVREEWMLVSCCDVTGVDVIKEAAGTLMAVIGTWSWIMILNYNLLVYEHVKNLCNGY